MMFTKIDEGLAIVPLKQLVSAEPQKPLGKGALGFTGSIEVNISISCLGNKRSAHVALWDAMNQSSIIPHAQTEGVWRSMWMRTSTKPQDLIFSVMHLLGTDIDVDYHRQLEDLMFELIAKCHYVPGWLTIGYDIPVNPKSGLLPMLPEWSPDSLPVYRDGTSVLPAFQVIDGAVIGERIYVNFDIVVKEEPIMGGHIVCAKIFEVNGEKLVKSRDEGSSSQYELKLATSLQILKTTCCLKSGKLGSILVIIGNTQTRRDGEGGIRNDRKTLVFFIGKIHEVYQRVGIGTIELQNVRNIKRRNHIRVGGRPGARLRECACTDVDVENRQNSPVQLPVFKVWVKQGDI